MPAMIWDWETERGKIPPNMVAKIRSNIGIERMEDLFCVAYFPAGVSHLADELSFGDKICDRIDVEDGSTIIAVPG